MTIRLNVERLGELLGRLSSEHEGEIVTAARKLSKLIREAGLTWPEILEPSQQIAPYKPKYRWGNHVAAARDCLARRTKGKLNKREIDFLFNAQKLMRLSERQESWLAHLCYR